MRLVRIFFTKQAEAAYISHLDLQRLMSRALRISGLPVWYSQGFNPHIYMQFALALPLFQESLAESVDCKLTADAIDENHYRDALNVALPGGIRVMRIAAPVYKPKDIVAAQYAFHFPSLRAVDIASAYNRQPEVMVLRKTKRSEQQLDLKRLLPRLEMTGESVFEARLPAGGEANINPALLTQFVENAFNVKNAYPLITRKQLFIENGDIFY